MKPNLSCSSRQFIPQICNAVSFQVANEFGLFDMHRNVWEWCEDRWHDNYEGAPTDGSAWLDGNDNLSQRNMLRGGSLIIYPEHCRSASCNALMRAVGGYTFDIIGFRVTCGGAARNRHPFILLSSLYPVFLDYCDRSRAEQFFQGMNLSIIQKTYNLINLILSSSKSGIDGNYLLNG